MGKFFIESKNVLYCWLVLSSAMKIVVSFNLPIIQFYHLFLYTFPKIQALFKKILVYFFSSPSKNGLMIFR